MLAEPGRTRLAAHLIELAAVASPEDQEIQATRAKVFGQCMQAETSLIGKAIFAVYQRDAIARSTS
jgi:fructose-specific component phosphotransferase system IIB-like protein